MALDDYVNREGINRRSFLRTAAAGLAGIAGYSSRPSYGADEPKTDSKPKVLTEKDYSYFYETSDWKGEEYLKKEYNSLVKKYIDVLNEKGKLDLDKKDWLRYNLKSSKRFKAKTKKEKVDLLKKEIELEEDADAYMKKYLEGHNYALIKAITYANPEYSPEFDKAKKRYNVDINSLDDSEKVKAYETRIPDAKSLEDTLSRGLISPLIRGIEGMFK